MEMWWACVNISYYGYDYGEFIDICTSLYNKNLLLKTINFCNKIQIKLLYETVLKLLCYKMQNNFLLNI